MNVKTGAKKDFECCPPFAPAEWNDEINPFTGGLKREPEQSGTIFAVILKTCFRLILLF